MGTRSARKYSWGVAEDIIVGLADLVGAGFGLSQSIDILYKDSRLRAAGFVAKDMSNGMTLSESLKKRFAIGDSWVMGHLEVTEHAGNVNGGLSQAGAMIRAKKSLNNDMAEIMFYPRLVTLGIVLFLNGLVFFLAPAMKNLLSSFGVTTGFGYWSRLTKPWVEWAIIVLTPVLLLALLRYQLLGWIVPRSVKKYEELHWFFASLEELLAGGFSLANALDALRDMSRKNRGLEKRLSHIAAKLATGARLSEAMSIDSGYWTYSCIARLATAEAGGQLKEGVAAVARDMHQKKERSISAMVHLVRVSSIAALGLAVFSITYSVYRPLIETIAQLSGL